MSNILHSKIFADQLQEISNMDFEVSESRGYPVLEQTKRNLIRGELVEGLLNSLSDYLDDIPECIATAFMTEDGVAIEIINDSVGRQVKKNAGAITLTLDLKFKNLLYDAVTENELYTEHMKQKEASKLQKAEAKKKKIATDSADRADRATNVTKEK